MRVLVVESDPALAQFLLGMLTAEGYLPELAEDFESASRLLKETEYDVAVLDLIYERRAPFDSDTTIAEIAGILRMYNIHTVVGDDYGAELTVSAFRRNGITYKPAELNRSEIYLNVLPSFTSGRVRLLDNERLIYQLVSLERRTQRSGHDSVDHPRGQHDDVANSAALAIVLLGTKKPTIVITPNMMAAARLPAGVYLGGSDASSSSERRSGLVPTASQMAAARQPSRHFSMARDHIGSVDLYSAGLARFGRR